MNMHGTLFETLEDRNLARLREVLVGRHKEWPITVRQIELLRVIEGRRGLANIISREHLCSVLHCVRRQLSQDVQDMRMLGIGIGAGRKDGSDGYYLITNAQELMETKTPIINHALTMLRTARELDVAGFDTVFGQLRLELFPEDKEATERAWLEAANG
jgi:biotin operon repressor